MIQLLLTLTFATQGPMPPRTPARQPASIGRIYVIADGIGVVYIGYDEELSWERARQFRPARVWRGGVLLRGPMEAVNAWAPKSEETRRGKDASWSHRVSTRYMRRDERRAS